MIKFEPRRLQTLLDGTGWTCYRAAQLVGVHPSTLQRALKGEAALGEPAWRLLQLMAQQRERDALITAPLLAIVWAP